MAPPPLRNFKSRFRQRRGIALILSISLIALMMILVVSLLDATKDGYKGAVISSHGERSRMVAKEAVYVALSQLQDATTQTFANSGTPKPWTSQPGAIRVHNMDGSLNTLYKLYSSNSMSVRTVAEVEADVPNDWKQRSREFVDLNEPFKDPEGKLRFPITDPRAMSTNPKLSVEGFSYRAEKGAIAPSEANPDTQRLPMPVRWIYMLKNGEMGTLSAEGKFIAPGNIKPTRSNPIISRFAFWTDDETSKINVNTASEGAFWDTPRADTSQERALAMTIPTRLEYMRHPGHPAGVSLSSVLLPNRRFSPLEFPVVNFPAMESMNYSSARGLWRLGRLTIAERDQGTSMGGSKLPNWQTLWAQNPNESIRQRRYVDIGDLVFDDADSSRFPVMEGTPNPKDGERRRSQFFAENPDSVELLEKSAFFLTTQSSAPEVTLFGTPRVATWPMHAHTLKNGKTLGDEQNRRDTFYNHKIALGAMVKDRPYFVQRSDPSNGIKDFRSEGAGANRMLFDYLRRLTGRPFPGFDKGSSTFLSKYGEDRDAIVLQIMDYIRGANFAEPQLPDKNQFSVLCIGVEYHGFGQVSPMQLASSMNPATTDNHPQGIGRMLTISEVALIITCRAEVDSSGAIQGNPSGDNADALKKPGDREIEVGFLVETFLPSHGWADYRPFTNLALLGGAPGAPLEGDHGKAPLPKYTVNGQPLVYQDKSGTSSGSPDMPPSKWYGAGGSLGVRGMSQGMLQFKPIVIKAKAGGVVPPLEFLSAADEGNQLKIAVYSSPASTDPRDLVQVVPLVLPNISAAAEIPVPNLAQGVSAAPLENRLQESASSSAQNTLIGHTDVVQSLAPMHGDYRLLATQRWAESRSHSGQKTLVFVPHPLWGKQRLAHSLRDQTMDTDSFNHEGYIEDLSYASETRPDMPDIMSPTAPSLGMWQLGAWSQNSLRGAMDKLRQDDGARGLALPGITGDFDNGIGGQPDGPYNNRPDDGHWSAVTQGKVPYFDNVSQVGTKVPPVSLVGFSPQRLMPSPVMFGSLPTGTVAHVPWQTLLFRPQPDHYGAKYIPDHLLLDLFWSPVLEPEPISTNFETDGKVNLNHEILPFRHITRATALHAAMKAETLMAIPDSASKTYKNGSQQSDRFRHHLNPKQTLALWKKEVFDQNKVFLTASQVCEQYLVPESMPGSSSEVSRAQMEAYWKQHRLTGDNSRERPYAHIHSRLTTRSNTYRVHFIAQSLTKARSSAPDTFDLEKDTVSATHSGSATLRRRLDLENPKLPDYMSNTAGNAKPLDHFYQWEVGKLQTY